jgi:hypothetical protein
MTLATARPRATGAAFPALLDRPVVVIVLGALLAGVLSWPHALLVWQDNTFFDTDDAMRLVQIRAWLDGQGWFDLVAHRLHPPQGLLMHWSRIVDVPVGGLIRLFEFFTGPDTAERLARIVFPLGLQLALVAVTVLFGRLLAGARALVPSMILIVLSGFNYEQFPAGRIDHHATQITLLMGMSMALLTSLAPGRARHAALAGLCIALSLAISLENLPFIAVIVAVLPLVWLFRPEAMRRPLVWFGGSLLLGAAALFAATVPPARYAETVCDAFSAAHLTGLAAGSAGLLLLAALSRRLTSLPPRIIALALVGATTAGTLLLTFPGCLHDPYARLDPVLRALWLSHVTEAQPLLAASRLRPDTMTMLGCPLFVGAVGLACAAYFERGLSRLRWTVVLALTLVGIAGTFWEIRVAASTQPLALLGGVWVVTTLLDRARRKRSPLLATFGVLLLLPFSTVAWAMVPTSGGDSQAARALAQGQACRATTALAPLAALPAGLVFAPIDDGSHLLVDTPHAVVAAPYHRNQAGNRTVIDGFLAQPDDAAKIVRAAGARYVAICPGEVGISLLGDTAPQGLAARLTAGEVPAWLKPVETGATPFRVFELQPGAR